MGPEAMDADGDAEAGDRPQNERPQQRRFTAFEQLRRANGSNHVHQRNVNAHGIIDRARSEMMLDHRRNFGHHFPGKIHGALFRSS